LKKHIVFVGLLPRDANRSELILYFSSFGRVVWLELFPPPKNDEFAYAHFLFDELQAVEKLFARGSHSFAGTAVRVRMWQPPSDESHSEALLNKRKVFVKNISPKTSKFKLLKHFSKFGKIQHIEQGPQSSGACSAIAFIIFLSAESAAECLMVKSELIDGFKIKCKPFMGAKSEPDYGRQVQGPSLNGEHGTISNYSSLIAQYENIGSLALEESHEKESRRKADAATQKDPRVFHVESKSCKRVEGLFSRPLESRAFIPSGSSAIRKVSLFQAGSFVPLRGQILGIPGQIDMAQTRDWIDSPSPEQMLFFSTRRPIYIHFFVVEGYI
jgi:RNA recognition motif-containing protein